MKSNILRATSTAVGISLIGTLVLGMRSTAAGREDDRFVYTVNVLCQFAGGTSINVHNPHDRTLTVTRTGIPLQLGQIPTPPQLEQREALKAGWAFLMGCDDIAALGGVGPAGAGNVVIESRQELDVWAVYVSIVAGGGIGETRGPVRVPAVRVGDRHVSR